MLQGSEIGQWQHHPDTKSPSGNFSRPGSSSELERGSLTAGSCCCVAAPF